MEGRKRKRDRALQAPFSVWSITAVRKREHISIVCWMVSSTEIKTLMCCKFRVPLSHNDWPNKDLVFLQSFEEKNVGRHEPRESGTFPRMGLVENTV